MEKWQASGRHQGWRVAFFGDEWFLDVSAAGFWSFFFGPGNVVRRLMSTIMKIRKAAKTAAPIRNILRERVTGEEIGKRKLEIRCVPRNLKFLLRLGKIGTRKQRLA
jgi:hypothetical protein